MSEPVADPDELNTRRRRRRAIIRALPIIPIMWVLAVGGCVMNTTEDVPGVLDTKLPIGCSIWHFTKQSQQPFRTFVLACPGVAAIRVWPLPIQQNWAEDWVEHLPPTPAGQKALHGTIQPGAETRFRVGKR